MASQQSLKAEVEYVRITDDEQGDETKLEIPVDVDGSINLTTLAHAFAGAYGLKYRNPDTGAFRALKVDDSGRVLCPFDGWRSDLLYVVIFHRSENKRKMYSNEGSASKLKKMDEKRCSDLIVLGLAFSVTEEDLRQYFEQYGQVLVAQVKRDFKTGSSKGFGFIRFAEFEDQVRVLSEKHHEISGRTCEVKIPDSQKSTQPTPSKKVFVGRVPDTFTKDEIKEYFETYGEVIDVFIPRPFRSFAFVTFADAEVAQSLCGQDHIIKNCSVHVGHATPKDSKRAGSPNQQMPGATSPDFAPPAGKMRGGPGANYSATPMWNGPVDCYANQAQGYANPNMGGQANRQTYSNQQNDQPPPWRFQTDLTTQQPTTPSMMNPSMPPPQVQQQYPQTAPMVNNSTLASGTQQAMQGMNNLNLNSLIGNAVQGATTQQAMGNLQQVISQAFMMGMASASALGTPTGGQAGTPNAPQAPPTPPTSTASQSAGVTEQLMALLGSMQQQQSRDGSGWYPSSSTSASAASLASMLGGTARSVSPTDTSANAQSRSTRSPNSSTSWKQQPAYQ